MSAITTYPAQTFYTDLRVKRETSVRTFRLGEVLVRHGLVSTSQVQQAIEVQASHPDRTHRERLGEILLARKMITAQELKTALLEQFWRNNGFWVID